MPSNVSTQSDTVLVNVRVNVYNRSNSVHSCKATNHSDIWIGLFTRLGNMTWHTFLVGRAFNINFVCLNGQIAISAGISAQVHYGTSPHCDRTVRNNFRAVHTMHLRMRFFITMNGLCGFQCKCSHDAITITLNLTQPISCEKPIAVASPHQCLYANVNM